MDGPRACGLQWGYNMKDWVIQVTHRDGTIHTVTWFGLFDGAVEYCDEICIYYKKIVREAKVIGYL